MGNSTGGGSFPSLFTNMVLWYTGCHSAAVSGDFDEFPILPSGVTVTNNPVSSGWAKDDLGNNKSVMRFDGITNFITVSNNSEFSLGSNYTLCCWIKLSNVTTNSGQTIVVYSTNANYSFGLQVNPYLNVFWLYHTSAIYQSFSYDPDTNWHFVVARRTSGVADMFVDMSQIGSTWSESTSVSVNTYSVNIGMLNSAYYQSGNIKDLMIYKGRALTVPELKLLMARTHPITGLGLMPNNGKYWRIS